MTEWAFVRESGREALMTAVPVYVGQGLLGGLENEF